MAAATTMASGLAGRYATALFELAIEQKALDEVASDLVRLRTMITESLDLDRLIRSPILSRGEQGQAMAALMARAEPSELTRRFIGVVAGNRRLAVLPDMIAAFEARLSEHRGEITADVTSASTLSDSQKSALDASLKAAMGSEVKVTAHVDESLIGGLVIKIGSRLVDSSLRTKLENLERAMKGVA